MEQPPVMNKAEADPASDITDDADANLRTKRTWLVVVVILVIVLAVVLAVVFGNWSSEPEPSKVSYSTGVSLITYYGISAKVQSRLATTEIYMEIANALNCSSVHMVTLQLPLNTRVTSLQTVADDRCTRNGIIQELKEAQEIFEEQVAQGLPGAFVEVEDAFTYSLQVSIPPLGSTMVILEVEQILQQQLGEVQFQIPLIPNEEVDTVVLDLSVQDLNGDPTEFFIELETVDALLENNSNTTAMDGGVVATDKIHLDIPDARQYNLPRVVRGRYKPGLLPESGLLYADNRCFEHYFVPDSSESMPRNILFLLDTSGSRNYNNKFVQSKEALLGLIDTLTPQDTFVIQTFGYQGTEDLWGSAPATQDEKEDAKAFLRSYNATRSRTNLNEALLEGLLRAKNMAEMGAEREENPTPTVTVLFLISDGYASVGERSRSEIANNVYELNKEGKVKIFSMGFQDGADMQLLDAIAIMNGGVSAPILAGQSIDFTSQIVEFFSSQIGTVLLSDVNVDVKSGNARVFGETEQTFSLLSSGYEVAVRGLLEVPDSPDNNLELRAVTSAATVQGINEWEAMTLVQGTNGDNDPSKASLCFQSYAHARVTQLMRLFEASKFIDHDTILELVTLANPDDCDKKEKVDCIKAEALALAFEANLVAKGLTAMITTEVPFTCKKLENVTEVCVDGTSHGGNRYGADYYYAESGTQSHGGVSFLLALLVVITIATTALNW